MGRGMTTRHGPSASEITLPTAMSATLTSWTGWKYKKCKHTLEISDAVSPRDLPLKVLAKEMWSFLGSLCLSDALVLSRTQLAQESNGIELWRRYHAKSVGIAEEIMDVGFAQLQQYPAASDEKGLATHIARWEELVENCGGNLDAATKRRFVLQIPMTNVNEK